MTDEPKPRQEMEAAGSECSARLGTRPTDTEIRLLSIELEKNLNTEFWMEWFGKWSEYDFIEATMRVPCHPEGWDYACLCCECQSNA